MEEMTIPLKEYLDEKFEENKSAHEKIIDTFSSKIEDHEERLKSLEDWKLVFVTKFSIYAAIALFLGSVISQIAISWLSNIFN